MIVAPSVLSLDYYEIKNQLEILNKKCQWIHFDVMDGNFVPNISFGPDIFKTFRKHSSLFMDVHLMVNDPEFISGAFIKAGADGITFHLESLKSIDEAKKLINKLKENYIKAGVSIKPKTSVEDLIPILDMVDLVLIMSVEPGFGGQKFMDSALDKIQFLDEYRKEHNLSYLIEVDGGINNETAHLVNEVGCDVIVAGSYVFKGDMEKNIDSISFYE